MIILRQKLFSRKRGDKEGGSYAGELGLATGIGGGTLLYANQDGITKKAKKMLAPVEDYSQLTINNGDIVSAGRKGGIYSHYGVAEVDPVTKKVTIHQYGNRTSLDPRDSYVHTTSLDEFGKGNKIHVERPNGKFTPEQIIERAKSQAGQKQYYSVLDHNCEHWARNIANGENISTQANRFGKNPIIRNLINKVKTKRFSKPSAALYDTVFKLRKSLPKEAGKARLTHPQAYQTTYMTAGGSILGSAVGDISAKKKATREADKLGLEKGSEERNKYIKNKRIIGRLAGAGAGAGLGFGGSKGIDYVRGSKIADKLQEKVGDSIDIKKQGGIMNLGKAMRGVRKEADVNDMVNDLSKFANSKRDYINGVLEHL